PLAHKGAVLSCAFSPDGKFVATGGADKFVRVFDLTTGRESVRLETGETVSGVAFSADGKRLVTGSDKGTAALWEVSTAKPVWKTTAGRGAVTGVAISADGRRIVTSGDKSFSVFDAPPGKMIMQAGFSAAINGIALAPDGKTLATATGDKLVGLWDAQMGRQLQSIQADSKAVAGVAFSPDSKTLAAAGT